MYLEVWCDCLPAESDTGSSKKLRACYRAPIQYSLLAPCEQIAWSLIVCPEPNSGGVGGPLMALLEFSTKRGTVHAVWSKEP